MIDQISSEINDTKIMTWVKSNVQIMFLVFVKPQKTHSLPFFPSYTVLV